MCAGKLATIRGNDLFEDHSTTSLPKNGILFWALSENRAAQNFKSRPIDEANGDESASRSERGDKRRRSHALKNAANLGSAVFVEKGTHVCGA